MRVLLYAPSLVGHPQVYCRVIGDILLEGGHSVVLAAGEDPDASVTRWRDLRPFAGHEGVECVDTRRLSATGEAWLRAEDVRVLQERCGIDATLLIEGDLFVEELERIGDGRAPRLHGRNVAIFGRTCEWFPGEDPYTGQPPRFAGGSWRNVLGRVRQRVLPRPGSPRHVFGRTLRNRRPVDVALVKDERVTERFGEPFLWMPEIYRVLQPRENERRLADWERFAGPILDWVRRAGASNVLLYFGTGTWYKGYDLFLRLAELDPCAFAIHAGAPDRREQGKPMRFDPERIRAALLREGRLFETGAYVESEDLIEFVFSSIGCFVSTHRLTLSSGTVLQALEQGRPVLTPASGLVGHRTRMHGLGLTYEHFNDLDLLAKWREIRRVPADAFRAAAAGFMARFSREAVGLALMKALEG
jgi:hypothetical protein